MNILALTCAELSDELRRRHGKGGFHAAALYREVFRRGNTTRFDGAPEFLRSPALAAQVAADLRLPDCRILSQVESEGVVKFASSLSQGSVIETVVIPSGSRTTLCVSSQVGCRMGCRFCSTGRMGFERNLATEEIVWQVFAARFLLGRRLDNIVFMGMGEPLDNFKSVMQAVRILSDQRGLDIPHRRITLSTAGHVEGIRKLAALELKNLRLAVSLHGSSDETRSRLMPINRRYPLNDLKNALRDFPLGRDSVIFFEYVLLSGVNDSHEDAEGLVRFCEGLPARVNLISYNGDGDSEFYAPSMEHVRRFAGWLAEKQARVLVRQSKGDGILAACGQLGSRLKERGVRE